MNTYYVTDNPHTKYSTFVDAFLMCGLCKSRADVRKLIQNGGCYVNDVRLIEDRVISTDDFLHGKFILLRKGKKNYNIIQFNNVEEFFK